MVGLVSTWMGGYLGKDSLVPNTFQDFIYFLQKPEVIDSVLMMQKLRFPEAEYPVQGCSVGK